MARRRAVTAWGRKPSASIAGLQRIHSAVVVCGCAPQRQYGSRAPWGRTRQAVKGPRQSAIL